jgi:hypothetical protein
MCITGINDTDGHTGQWSPYPENYIVCGDTDGKFATVGVNDIGDTLLPVSTT